MIPPHALFWQASPRERLPRWRELFEGLSAKSGTSAACVAAANPAHKRAKWESPPPPAIDRMLELTRRRRQANPSRQCYNFSLVLKADIRIRCCGCWKRTAADRWRTSNLLASPTLDPRSY